MKITQHGGTRKHAPLFKGTSLFTNARGKPLVFFGWSEDHVRAKCEEWLHDNKPVSEPRQVAKPQLRLVSSK